MSTSMIASMALEQKGVSLWDSLWLSVARFTSPSPDTFWHETLFRRYFIDIHLRVLLLGLILSTLAVRFSSTILLSDVGLGRVIGFPGSSTNRTGFAWSNANYLPRSDTGIFGWSGDFVGHNAPFQSLQDYWTGQPSASHTFAEYSEPGITHEEIDDTGLTVRSFLPISDQNIRNSLRNFSGLAFVFDTRVVCVRPELVEASLTADIYNLTLSLRSLGATIPSFTATRGDILAELPRVDSRGSHGWLIYPLNASVGGLLSPLDAASRQGVSLTYTDYHLPITGGFRSQEETSDIVALRGQLGAGNPGEDSQNRSILQLGSIDLIRGVVDQSSEQWQEYCSSASEMEENGLWDANIYNRSTYSWVKEMALGVKQPIALCTGNCRILGKGADTIRSNRGMA